MKVLVAKSTLELIQGDITRQDSHAVVNAANQRLAPGGGVAGAIHQAAGPELWEECRKLGGCPTGEARITKGYSLPNEYVIHTVGPVYSGKPQDAELLAACYRESIKLAVDNEIESVSFPALSTGIFGYPTEEAAPVALGAIAEALMDYPAVALVRMVLYADEAFVTHQRAAVRMNLQDVDGL